MVLDIKIWIIHILTFQLGAPREVEYSYYRDNTTVRGRHALLSGCYLINERPVYTIYWTWQALLICKDVSEEEGGAPAE